MNTGRCHFTLLAVATAAALISLPARAQLGDAPLEGRLAANAMAEAEPTATYPNGIIITIHGKISDVTTKSLRRRIDDARQRGAQIIIFDIDTPGGMVSSALDICDLIQNTAPIKTVAWVTGDAYSAGSMISLACDEIVMAYPSRIGDCGVILGGPTGPQEVPEELRAKAESPVIEQFRASAARHGHDLLLCESFVVKERVVYWLENTETGERRFVDEPTKQKLLGEPSDALSFAPQPASDGEASPWQLITSYEDPVTGKASPLSQPVVKSTELLTMAQSKAHAFGFCKAIVDSQAELRARYGIEGDLPQLESTWSEDFTGWLTSMPVRMFLLVIILLGAYVEFNTPGVGVPGLVALIALGIFVGAPYMTGLANVWEIVILLAGFLLLAVEIFVIPGFGIAGLSGIVCIIVGLLATFMPDEPGRTLPLYLPQLDQSVEGLKAGIVVLASGSTAAVVAMIIFSRIIPKLAWLHGAIPPNPLPDEIKAVDPYHGYARVGDRGLVESTLRPAGKVRFGDLLVDVVTEGDYIEPPGEVEVVARTGNRVVVRSVRGNA